MALQQIKERGALPMIDRGDIRQAIDRCSNIWASLPGAGYIAWHALDSLSQNLKKRAERSGEIDVWAESPRLSPLCYLHQIVCLFVQHYYRDNAITYKAQRDKNSQRTEAGERGNYWHADASACDVAALDAKYTKELADAKAENDALRDDVAAGRRRLHIKAVCQSVREATTPSGVDNAAPTGRHRWTGTFHPQREADHYAKQLEGTQKYINEQCR